jgi:transcriptional regulator with XRE-family HTH domain
MHNQIRTRKIVKKYRKELGFTQRAFAKNLGQSIKNIGITHATIGNWEAGKHEPGTDFLLLVMMVYSDWRMEWAIDCLCAKLPEVFDRDEHGALTTLKRAVLAG